MSAAVVAVQAWIQAARRSETARDAIMNSRGRALAPLVKAAEDAALAAEHAEAAARAELAREGRDLAAVCVSLGVSVPAARARSCGVFRDPPRDPERQRAVARARVRRLIAAGEGQPTTIVTLANAYAARAGLSGATPRIRNAVAAAVAELVQEGRIEDLGRRGYRCARRAG